MNPRTEPLFSDLDPGELIPIAEVSKKTGISKARLLNYAKKGIIPGGRQVAPHTPWMFKRGPLEKWWQDFNA